MRHEPQPAAVALGRRGAVAGGEQRRVLVLQPAASATEHVEKHVALKGQVVPHQIVGAHDAPEIRRRARAVPGRRLSHVHQLEGVAPHVERMDAEIPGHDRLVHQVVVVGRAPPVGPAAGRRRQSGRGARPLGRPHECHLVPSADRVGQRHERGRAAHHAQLGPHPIGRDRMPVREQAVRDGDERRPVRGDGPAISRRAPAPERERPAVGARSRDRLDLPGVVLHAVEAGRPDGHHEDHRVLPAGGDARRHVESVVLRLRKAQRVRDALAGLSVGRAGGDQYASEARGQGGGARADDGGCHGRSAVLCHGARKSATPTLRIVSERGGLGRARAPGRGVTV